MNRRSIMGALASLPFLGWLRPADTSDIMFEEAVVTLNIPPDVVLRLTVSEKRVLAGAAAEIRALRAERDSKARLISALRSDLSNPLPVGSPDSTS